MPSGTYGEKAAGDSDSDSDDKGGSESFAETRRGGGRVVVKTSRTCGTKKNLWIALTLAVCALVAFVGVGIVRELVWRGRIHGVKVCVGASPSTHSSARPLALD